MATWNRSVDALGHALFPGGRVLAAAGLVFFAPVLLAVAVLIKCTSPGPVLLKRHRRGMNGETITVWEFRPAAGLATPLGAFLHDSRLDLLPRLLSMLHGELPIKALLRVL